MNVQQFKPSNRTVLYLVHIVMCCNMYRCTATVPYTVYSVVTKPVPKMCMYKCVLMCPQICVYISGYQCAFYVATIMCRVFHKKGPFKDTSQVVLYGVLSEFIDVILTCRTIYLIMQNLNLNYLIQPVKNCVFEPVLNLQQGES